MLQILPFRYLLPCIQPNIAWGYREAATLSKVSQLHPSKGALLQECHDLFTVWGDQGSSEAADKCHWTHNVTDTRVPSETVLRRLIAGEGMNILWSVKLHYFQLLCTKIAEYTWQDSNLMACFQAFPAFSLVVYARNGDACMEAKQYRDAKKKQCCILSACFNCIWYLHTIQFLLLQ